MSTIRDLYKAYINENFYTRKKFFDACKHEDFNKSSDRFLKCRLAKGIKPRGKVYDKLLVQYLHSHWGQRYGKSPAKVLGKSAKYWPTPDKSGEQ